MSIIQSLNRLDLYNDALIYKHISEILAHYYAIISDYDCLLLLNNVPVLPQLMRKGILVDFLKEASAQSVANGVTAPNNLL